MNNVVSNCYHPNVDVVVGFRLLGGIVSFLFRLSSLRETFFIFLQNESNRELKIPAPPGGFIQNLLGGLFLYILRSCCGQQKCTEMASQEAKEPVG